MSEFLPVMRTAVDTGMVVLILLVQLIIYPSFHAIEHGVFSSWHRKYVGVIGMIVIPLMLIQAGCITLQLLTTASRSHVLSAGAVLGAWIVTFALSVPCHRKLEHQGKDPETINRLIQTNWLRTACWIVAFAAGLVRAVGRG
jgi:hypothetical protein